MEITVTNALQQTIQCGTDISSDDSIAIAPGSDVNFNSIIEVLFLQIPESAILSEDGKKLSQNQQFIEIKNPDYWTHIIFFGNALPHKHRDQVEGGGNEKKNVTVTGDENED